MFTLKNLLIFLAGGETFHAISHFMLPYFVKLPLEINGITFTQSMNEWAIIVNGLIAVALLFLASRVKA